ncbi:MAG: excinuclease ABC subunit UvrC [Thermotogaceae bacterium]|nr:excinuclease ABC subunit UvrC [Thermotogaceae bacterium]
MTVDQDPAELFEHPLKEVAIHFPDEPGVYIFSEQSKPLYIGKAKSLKKRILSYFRLTNGEPQKVSGILQKADHLKYILVNSEKEALMLEANLIYENKPPFNTMLKDNRFYPYVMLTQEKFPRIKVVRGKSEKGRYFGPFSSVGMVRQVLEIIYRTYGIRPCEYDLNKVQKPCLEYQLGRCSAPCAHISEEEYADQLKKVEKFLKGNVHSLKSLMKEKMAYFSEHLLFEKAKIVRDLLTKLDDLFMPQYITLPKNKQQDFFAIDLSEGKTVIFRMKDGAVFGYLTLDIDGALEIEDVLGQFYYGRQSEIPDSIILNLRDLSQERIKELFDVGYVGSPRTVGEEKILEIAGNNLIKEVEKKRLSAESLKLLQVQLGLKKYPASIEGIDIAHTQGLYTVASVVSFSNGFPDKSRYRKYRISQLSEPDDFEAMRIVTRRRYAKHPLPDLLLIDGGIGQVHAVKEVLEKELQITDYQMVGLAKEEETIIFPDERKELKLPENSPSLRVLIFVRDESHRFANAFHAQLRDDRMEKTVLEDIPGVGKIRKIKLLKRFRSLKNISKAEVSEIAEIVRDKELAYRIKEHLQRNFR